MLSDVTEDEAGREESTSSEAISVLEETREMRFLTAPDLERLCLEDGISICY